jgi:hypothetical protein
MEQYGTYLQHFATTNQIEFDLCRAHVPFAKGTTFIEKVVQVLPVVAKTMSPKRGPTEAATPG